MKIDFLDVVSDSLTTVPGRLTAAYLAIALGTFAALILEMLFSWEWRSLEGADLVLFGFFGPVAAIFGAIANDWFAFLCVPMSLVSVVRAFFFVVNDRGISEIYTIWALSFLAMGWGFRETPFCGVIVCCVVCFGLYRARQARLVEEGWSNPDE